MSRIDELIEELCPEGTQFRPLGQLLEQNFGGGTPSRSNLQFWDGDIPWASVGDINATQVEIEYTRQKITRVGLDSSSSKLIDAGWVVVAVKISPGAMRVVTSPIAINQDIRGLKLDPSINPYFLTYYFKTFSIVGNGTIVQGITSATLEKIRIPVPPLEVQREIVSILDKFTQLEAELEAELEARRIQYEITRDRLLDFSGALAPHPMSEVIRGLCPDGVPLFRLDELFDVRGGFTPSKSEAKFWSMGTIPWFRMEDIREGGRILNSAAQLVSGAAAKSGGAFEADSIIISTSATIGEHALVTVPFLANQRFSVLTRKPEFANAINPKFAFYIGFKLCEYCKENTSVSSFAGVVMSSFKAFQFPLPPLGVQREIVSILDKLDTLVNDITIGLPAEIAARRRQYEYYRNKLLTFKELEAA